MNDTRPTAMPQLWPGDSNTLERPQDGDISYVRQAATHPDVSPLASSEMQAAGAACGWGC